MIFCQLVAIIFGFSLKNVKELDGMEITFLPEKDAIKSRKLVVIKIIKCDIQLDC